MKKIVCIILVTLLFTISGCKSDAVKHVENLIDTLVEDAEKISEVESEYNKLSSEDQKKVSNYDDLIKMKKRLYVGTYQRLSFKDYFNDTPTKIELLEDGDWGFNKEIIDFGQYDFEISEKYGVMTLEDYTNPHDIKIFVNEKDIKKIYDKAFLVADINTYNYKQYWDLAEVAKTSAEANTIGKKYITYSKLYKDGYIFANAKEDEIVYYFAGSPSVSEIGERKAYIGHLPVLHSAKGKVYYVHKEYATYTFNENVRELIIFGEEISDITFNDQVNINYPW